MVQNYPKHVYENPPLGIVGTVVGDDNDSFFKNEDDQRKSFGDLDSMIRVLSLIHI